MEKYNEEKAKAVESISATKDSRRSLGQIANDSNDYQALVDASNRVAIAGGIDRELAQDFVFSGRSEGFDAEALAKFIPVVSADSLSKVAGQVNTLYGGSLSAEQTINAVLSGARSSRLNFEDLSSGLASVAEGGRLQKSSAEEQIGSLSVLASYFKSGDTAADRLKAFQTRMALGGQEFGVAGMGIVDATRAIQGMSPEDRSKLLGESQEVNAAFSALAENLPTIQQRIHEINGAIVNEAYHGLQHRHQIKNLLIDTGKLVLYRRSQLVPTEDPEWQANVFASCILMPTRTVQMVANEAHGKLIEDMMWLFGVSKTAAKVRLSQLRRQGLIPD